MRALQRRELQVGLLIAFALQMVVAAWLLLNPSPATPIAVVFRVSDLLSALSLPEVITKPEHVEFALNAALFVPAGAILRLLAPRPPWWVWIGVGFLASGAIELAQWAFLDTRSGTWVDVWANTLGFGFGAAAAALMQQLLRLTRARRGTRLALL